MCYVQCRAYSNSNGCDKLRRVLQRALPPYMDFSHMVGVSLGDVPLKFRTQRCAEPTIAFFSSPEDSKLIPRVHMVGSSALRPPMPTSDPEEPMFYRSVHYNDAGTSMSRPPSAEEARAFDNFEAHSEVCDDCYDLCNDFIRGKDPEPCAVGHLLVEAVLKYGSVHGGKFYNTGAGLTTGQRECIEAPYSHHGLRSMLNWIGQRASV